MNGAVKQRIFFIFFCIETPCLKPLAIEFAIMFKYVQETFRRTLFWAIDPSFVQRAFCDSTFTYRPGRRCTKPL